ncbi:VOC family protein [Conexibacter woesei]|uniref:Glyoxalase/bleomycin resistance protein/dioxygenase n=1 Tax=Conexibacter woesei (strain DSM 14684 / CCUG 47730 / CIP 108061 / JCM 11494 / NBRC 100937 / ID131577) TaxID=469383 RepID=D3F6H4_CONWI|nr:VOC family protein [Conexibacter woesei]ADB50741.1 Glyoxalase/bleomycin resistance protein/dioxygenase [Conexibacter woesei DSM 14684]
MTISRIRTLTAPVADQDRALAFYVDSMGFEVRTDTAMGELRWLEVAPPGSDTAIVLHPGFGGMQLPALTGVILESGDIDADTERLRGSGVEVDGPNELPWGRQATFSDPDGNGFVLSAA